MEFKNMVQGNLHYQSSRESVSKGTKVSVDGEVVNYNHDGKPFTYIQQPHGKINKNVSPNRGWNGHGLECSWRLD